MAYKFLGYDNTGLVQTVIANPTRLMLQYKIDPATNYNSADPLTVGFNTPFTYNNGVDTTYISYDNGTKTFTFNQNCDCKIILNICANTGTSSSDVILRKNGVTDISSRLLVDTSVYLYITHTFVATDTLQLITTRNGVDVTARTDYGSSQIRFEILSQ